MEAQVNLSVSLDLSDSASSKPPLTIRNYLNEAEMDLFKERRRFHNWRDKGHYYFDKIWSELKIMTRSEAYSWLAQKLGLDERETHFRKFNRKRCEDAIFYCQQLLNDMRRLDLDLGDKPKTPFYIL